MFEPRVATSDSRVGEFAAAHAIAELELEAGGGLERALDEGRSPLAAELALLERCFATRARRSVRELLEVGCGLGTLLIPLLRRDLWVTGLDLQAEAVASCRARVEAAGLSTRVVHGDAANLVNENEYDAALLMRGLLALLPSEAAQRQVLKRLRKAVRPGGLVVVDHRNLLAMWPVFGRRRVQRCELPDGRELELGRQATIVSLEGRVHERRWARVGRLEGGDAWAQTWEQHDHLRVTTVSETCSLLSQAGFEIVHREAHPAAEGPFGTSHDDPAHVWIVGRRPK